MLKAVIAEDDTVLRRSIIKKLAMYPQIDISYSTDNGKDLFKAITKIKPQLIITDITMPGMSGIEAVKKIRDKLPETEIIFVTSYSEFIREAVNLYAFDFIEKPIDYQRLEVTIERIFKKTLSTQNPIEFKTVDGTKIVNEQDIYIVEAAQKDSRVYTREEIFLSTNSLKDMDKILLKNVFFKASRSFIINLHKVKSLKRSSRTSFQVNFIGKDYIACLSKTRYEEFRKAIKKLRGHRYE